tara:strand:+ start:508 stop:723 length:216 start_codon:yes stop_codon:yes gene_type:complete
MLCYFVKQEKGTYMLLVLLYIKKTKLLSCEVNNNFDDELKKEIIEYHGVRRYNITDGIIPSRASRYIIIIL